MNNNVWNNKIEEILEIQKQKCISYKWMHERESNRLAYVNTVFNYLAIILSFTVATVGIVDASEASKANTQYNQIINIVRPILAVSLGTFSALQEKMKYEKNSELHRISANRYNMLFNNIDRMLSLDTVMRNNVKDYFKWATENYDSLYESSPDVSSSTMKAFEQKYNINLNTLKESFKTKRSGVNALFDVNDVALSKHETGRYELERFMLNSYS